MAVARECRWSQEEMWRRQQGEKEMGGGGGSAGKTLAVPT